jgi:hypothetical protein
MFFFEIHVKRMAKIGEKWLLTNCGKPLKTGFNQAFQH